MGSSVKRYFFKTLKQVKWLLQDLFKWFFYLSALKLSCNKSQMQKSF